MVIFHSYVNVYQRVSFNCHLWLPTVFPLISHWFHPFQVLEASLGRPTFRSEETCCVDGCVLYGLNSSTPKNPHLFFWGGKMILFFRGKKIWKKRWFTTGWSLYFLPQDWKNRASSLETRLRCRWSSEPSDTSSRTRPGRSPVKSQGHHGAMVRWGKYVRLCIESSTR